jgi:hypothetical protein
VDHKLRIVVAHDRDDLEQIGTAGRAEVEGCVVFLIVDRERVSHGVFDVLVGDAVFARRRMDLHCGIVIRNFGRTWYNYFPGKHAVLDEFGRNLIGSYIQLATHELALADHTVSERRESAGSGVRQGLLVGPGLHDRRRHALAGVRRTP